MTEKQNDINPSVKYKLDVSLLLDLPVPQECMEGIEANCELLRMHARKVEAFLIPDEADAEIDE
jgi:hypothetical protein